MFKVLNTALAFIFTLTSAASAAGNHPNAAWVYYHFDGSAFVAGPASDGSAFVAVREKVQPVVLTTQPARIEETALPDSMGAISGICYLQSSGGKLGGGGGFKPSPRLPLLISSGGKQFVTVETDDFGYFVAVLPAGTYTVGSRPFSAEITVERGITTLVPLRIGKRMVD